MCGISSDKTHDKSVLCKVGGRDQPWDKPRRPEDLIRKYYFLLCHRLRVQGMGNGEDSPPALLSRYFLVWLCKINAKTTIRMRMRLQRATTSKNHHSS